MEKAIIMDIQRYSIHDGPGIRTTVFFKGCHMSCKWCHNPESQKMGPEMMFYSAQCVNCGACAQFCRKGAVQWGNGKNQVDVSLCAQCDEMVQCALRCPAEALQVCGREMTVDQVLEQVRRDKQFYGSPEDPLMCRGGVTCSGGEPLLQGEFAAKLLKTCCEEGTGTCVDTTLNVPWKMVEQVLPYTDLFLVDVKILNQDMAQKYTGKDSQQMQENLKRLAVLGKPVILRTPLLRGVNDTPEETGAREKFLAGMDNILRRDKFYVTDHGAKKYAALGREDWLTEFLKQH